MSGLLLLHVTLVVISLVLFTWRGVRMWSGRPVDSRRAGRLIPDTIDTLLLISGVVLAYLWHVAPWADGWLAAKLAAIVVYILFGFVALQYRGDRRINRVSFIIALLVMGYIVAVAHTMQIWPWL
ncbi:hypothetical protein FE236_02655 [Mariprofundus erugo]|uniref:SirB2 family protein n=1 Tax=Mariprofundus erugo TaxID=2528639 RepID=UPI0010FD69E1|nr:SirB2 family protein [Mariprofundus erugo]TLS78004.1 hypothetical protein FE236_02655 [Mariprofundus erugo]